MKKTIVLAVTLMLIVSVAVTGYAVTPTLKIPELPQISNIRFNVEVKVSQSFLDRWFMEHPVNFARCRK